jgi:hypothetical protein
MIINFLCLIYYANDLKEIAWLLAQDVDQSWALVNTVMNS